MKNFILLLLSLLFFSCQRHEFHLYPTLDGEYVVRSVTFSRSLEDKSLNDTTLYSGYFEHKNITGPLDSIHINKTKMSFSGNKLYIEQKEYNINVTQDFITRRWVFLNINYFNPQSSIIRRYIILEDGLEYLILDFPKRGFDDFYDYGYSLYLVRVGP